MEAIDEDASVAVKKQKSSSNHPGQNSYGSRTLGDMRGQTTKSQSAFGPLGRLPTLGLSKFQANDFGDETRNPFYVQDKTEKILVVRELEREVKDLNKYEKDTLKVHHKNIMTRLDRSGAINDVSAIPARKVDFNPTKRQLNRLKEICPDVTFMPSRKDQKKNNNQLALQDSAEDQANQNKQKLNIFDA